MSNYLSYYYNRLISILKNGLCFLSSLQLDSGEFLTKRWSRSNRIQPEYVRDVFTTAFISNSLKTVGYVIKDDLTLSKMIKKSLGFILSQNEDGFFRFFGKGSNIHFDLDTTSTCLSALRRFGVSFDYYDIACQILRYKRKDGSFFTWVEDRGAPYRRRINDIDWCVNANILYFFSLFNIRLTDTERFLTTVLKKGFFKVRSLYYESPMAFIYFLSRVYFELNLEPPEILIDYTMQARCKDCLDYAFLLSSSILLGVKREFHDIVSFILKSQRSSGGWDSFIFFTEGFYTLFDVVYGSEALTTALILESLSLFILDSLSALPRTFRDPEFFQNS